MDLELKDFEKKINNITEQFMSLLDSNDVIEPSVDDKCGDHNVNCGTSTGGNATCVVGQSDNNSYSNYKNISTFGHNVGGISFEGASTGNTAYGGGTHVTPNCGDTKYGDTYNGSIHHTSNYDKPNNGSTYGCAVPVNHTEYTELNSKLESLYENKKNTNSGCNCNPSIAFSDSNIGSVNGIDSNCNSKTTTKDKEVYNMGNYHGEGNKENPFYAFASIPTDKSLVEKKNWKDVLFMDIPWDTKIDVWGGIKKFCTAQVRITFN